MPRIEVPERVFDALRLIRARRGSMILVDIDAVKAFFITEGYELEVDWLLANQEAVIQGAIQGYVKEGEQLPPTKPLESDDTGDV